MRRLGGIRREGGEREEDRWGVRRAGSGGVNDGVVAVVKMRRRSYVSACSCKRLTLKDKFMVCEVTSRRGLELHATVREERKARRKGTRPR